jgi:hypothetical protein
MVKGQCSNASLVCKLWQFVPVVAENAKTFLFYGIVRTPSTYQLESCEVLGVIIQIERVVMVQDSRLLPITLVS